MPIVSESVTAAQNDIDRLGPAIEEWTNNFLELLDNVRDLDLVFQEAEGLDLNYIALCDWSDASSLVVIQTIPPTQIAEERKRTLAMTSVIAATLHRLGYFDVAVVLLADDVGKTFRQEGLVGRSRTIRGCSRVPLTKSKLDFSLIRGHVAHSAPSAFSN